MQMILQANILWTFLQGHYFHSLVYFLSSSFLSLNGLIYFPNSAANGTKGNRECSRSSRKRSVSGRGFFIDVRELLIRSSINVIYRGGTDEFPLFFPRFLIFLPNVLPQFLLPFSKGGRIYFQKHNRGADDNNARKNVVSSKGDYIA